MDDRQLIALDTAPRLPFRSHQTADDQEIRNHPLDIRLASLCSFAPRVCFFIVTPYGHSQLNSLRRPGIEKMLQEGAATAAREEYAAHPEKVVPDDGIFSHPAHPKDPAVSFIGAVLCDQYVVVEFIAAGSTGRGWVATDGPGGPRIFIKTFRSYADVSHSIGTREMHLAMVQREVVCCCLGTRSVLPSGVV